MGTSSWIKGIQSALDYIESNLDGELDINEIGPSLETKV